MKNTAAYQIGETQLNFKLSNELKEKIERYAVKNKLSVSMVIRLAVSEKIEEDEREEQTERKLMAG